MALPLLLDTFKRTVYKKISWPFLKGFTLFY